MKTVKRGSEVKRVSDANASALVKDGWVYCPKAEWKAIRDGRPNAKAETSARSDDSSPVPCSVSRCHKCGTPEVDGNCEKCNPTPRWKL